MGLHYENLVTTPIIGTVVYTYTDPNKDTIATATRTGWTLTSAYQTEGATKPTKAFAVSGYSKLNLDILYTMGAAETGNSIDLKIEGSPDGVNYYRIPNETVSGATSTIVAREFNFVGSDAASATISIGLDLFYKYVKVSCKETGVASNFGNVYIEATLAGK